MRRNSLVLILVVGIVLAGCSGGGGNVAASAPSTAPAMAPSTVPPGTTSIPIVPTATTNAPTTTRPVLVDGVPQIAVTPARAAVGARVRIEGTGFTDGHWKATGVSLWLAENAGCNLYAEAVHTITVSAAGRLTGEFVVPAVGACRMSAIGERPVTSGVYRIVFSCTACAIGDLEVTTTAGPCVDVGFAPNSDNLASEIVASGMGCVEAEALVRKVGPQVRSVGGPSRVEVDAFVCIRTAETDRGLPTSYFECTSGSATVTFIRT
jgi:hypothetical protein